jgi:hypothetical protein
MLRSGQLTKRWAEAGQDLETKEEIILALCKTIVAHLGTMARLKMSAPKYPKRATKMIQRMNVAILGVPCHNGKLKFENKKTK